MQSAYSILSSMAYPVLHFPHYLVNGTIIGKTLLNIKCVFLFSLQYLSEKFLILRRTWLDIIIKIHWSTCKEPVILVAFYWNLNCLKRFSKILSDIRYHGNPSSGSWVVPCARTDRLTYRHDEAQNRSSQFWERAWQKRQPSKILRCEEHYRHSVFSVVLLHHRVK
jgi:hypothetical protein